MPSINFCRNLINPIVIQNGLLLRSRSIIVSKCQLSSFASYSRWQSLKSNPKFRFLAISGVSFALATVFITGTEYFKLNNVFSKFKVKKSSSLNVMPEIVSLNNVPDVQPSRIVAGPAKLNIKLTLFQYQTCPFCCKVRAFLDYYGVPYDVIEVNPVLRQQLKFSKNYKKVPLLIVHKNGEDQVMYLKDSSVIISAISSYLLSRNPNSNHHNESLKSILSWYQNAKVINDSGNETNEIINKYFLMFGDIEERKYKKIENLIAEERRWRRWADDVLVHTLSPNIYRTWDEALSSFQYFSKVGEWEKHFPDWERYLVIYVGASAMYLIGKRLKKRHNLKDDVRESLYDACRYWLKFIGKERKFMGGERPNLSDLAVYGALNSIEGCDAFKDLLKHTQIGKWYYNVQEHCNNHSGYNYLTIYKL